MRIHSLFNDEDAVSPVIGVILMVAITVILAAVIASFVLGLGQQSGEVAPQASFSFDYDTSVTNLTITHDSGNPVPQTELYLRGTDFYEADSGNNTWASYEDGNNATVSGSIEGKDAVVAGDRATFHASSSYEISVVWESAEGTDSSTLASDEGPDA